jgi:voltage-gated potassium channel
MILGYGIIAIPTGIVTSEMAKEKTQENAFKPYVCHNCKATNHPIDAKYCHGCSQELLS